MLRVSEAAVLTWRDIDPEADGTGRLLIRRSKTDAEGQGAVLFLSAPTMAALELIRNEAAAKDCVFGLRPNPDLGAHQTGGAGCRSGGRVQRALAAGGDGARSGEGGD